MTEKYSKTVKNALEATKYTNILTNETSDLEGRQMGSKQLHPKYAELNTFIQPDTELNWTRGSNNDELGMRSVRIVSERQEL